MRQQAFQQQQQQQQPFYQPQLQPQPTGFGSNNPFALNPQPSPVPPLPSFNPSPSPAPAPIRTQSQPVSNEGSPTTANNTFANARRPHDDGKNSHLASLLANREDGLDTFGNIGQTRLGHGNTGPAIVSQRTGANPFATMQAQQQQQQQTQGRGNDQPFFSI